MKWAKHRTAVRITTKMNEHGKTSCNNKKLIRAIKRGARFMPTANSNKQTSPTHQQNLKTPMRQAVGRFTPSPKNKNRSPHPSPDMFRFRARHPAITPT
jgi:hypothetical protein